MQTNKRFFATRLMLLVALLCVGINVRATLTFSHSNGTLTVSGNVAAGERLTVDIANSSNNYKNYKSTITAVVIGNGISGIEADVFNTLSNITKVTINSDVLKFGTSEGVCQIFPYATSLYFGSSMTSVPDWTINTSNSKITYVSLPSSIKKIGVRGLSGASFTTLSLPYSVETLDNYAFADCKKLKTISIPSSSNLTTINTAAFQGCSSLESFNIPDKLQTLKEDGVVAGVMTEFAYPIFKGCTNLKTLNISSNYITNPSTSYTSAKNLSRTFPYVETLNLFTTDNGSATNKISRHLFDGAEHLVSVSIGGGVLEVGDSAFVNSTLKQVTVNSAKSTTYPTITFGKCCFGFNNYSAPLEEAYIYRSFQYNRSNWGVFEQFSNLKTFWMSVSNSNANVPTYTCNNCTNLSDVRLWIGYATGTSNHVKGIGTYAFANCPKLTSITIPQAVQTIENTSFSGSKNLTDVTIYSNYITNPTTAYTTSKNIAKTYFPYAKKIILGSSINAIGSYAFAVAQDATATPLATLDMSAATGLTSIPSYMCSDQTNLTSVLFPSSVKTIGNSAFLRSKLQTLVLPASLTTISDYAFNNMQSLTSIDFSKLSSTNKLTIGGSAFAGAVTTSFGTLTLPANELELANNAFGSCNMKVNIPYSAKALTMANGAFGTSNNMVSELILDRPYTSGGQLFKKSETLPENRLQKLTLGENLTRLSSDNDFSDCEALTEITINSDAIAKKDWAALANESSSENLKTLFPKAEIVNYGANVTAIGNSAWYRCITLKTVNLPTNSKIERIGGFAFRKCENLKTFDLSKLRNLKRVEYAALSETALTGNVTINSKVEYVGTFAFASTGFTDASIVIDKAPITLGSNIISGINRLFLGRPVILEKSTSTPFSNLKTLTELRIGGYTDEIHTNMFSGCSALETLNLDFNDIYHSLTTIGSKAFDACTSLPEVTIPENLQTLATDAFVNCTALKTVNMNSNYITSATTYTTTANVSHCFQYVENLNFGPAVEKINSNFFNGTQSLKKVVIPSNVITLSPTSFYGSKQLTDVTINSNAVTDKDFTSISRLSDNFNKVETLTLGKDVKALGNRAFYGKSDGTFPLKTVRFEEGSALTSIGQYTFCHCEKLTDVTLPESLTSLAVSAFAYCSSLKEVVVPQNVKTMGNTIFSDCTSLEKVTFLNPVPVKGVNGLFNNDSKLSLILVPHGGLRDYRKTTGYSAYHKNTVAGPNIRAIGFTSHDDTKAYVQGEYENATEINERIYTRTYTKSDEYRNFNALYLPFELSYEEWADYGDMYCIKNVREYDKDQDGEIESWAIEVRRMQENADNIGSSLTLTKPNTPYLFIPKESGTIILDGVSSTLASSDVIEDGDAETWCASTEYRFIFNGNYTLKNNNFPADSYFATTNKGVMKYSTKDSSIKPYRWYMGVYPQDGPFGFNQRIKPSMFHPGVEAATGPDPVVQNIYIVVEGEDELEDAATAIVDGVKAKVISADVIYDINGRKVNGADMQKGQVYIKNGAKYIYK